MVHSIKSGQNDSRQVLRGILEDLESDGIVSSQDGRKVLALSKNTGDQGAHPLVLIAERRVNSAAPPHAPLTLEALVSWLAKKTGLAYHRIDPLKIDVSACTAVVSYAYAARFKILPVDVSEDQVLVATAEPWVTEWEEELSCMLRKRVQKVIANPMDIARYLVEFYALTESVKRAFGKADKTKIDGSLNLEQMIELGRAGKLDANDRYVVNIVDWLLQYAFDQRASDIHLEPRRENSDIRFRIDGVLHLVYQLPTVVMNAVTSRLKVLGRMDLAEKRRPQDGRLKTKTPTGGEVELRLSTMPTLFGEKLVMRIFDPEVTIRSFEDLGLENHQLGRWKEMVGNPYGIILVTGPTGSGKTTTLYSTLKQLARPEVNVCTIEDPIEMAEPRFNQMQVLPAINLDFASGLRTMLRQDPDIIMVGEIRDLETAEMAVQAALTGHLVFSTLHTNDAVSAIVRLMDIGVPHYLIKATVLGVMAQRLVRTLCPACKKPGEVEDEIWDALVSPWKMKKPKTVYRPAGCLECRETGYQGRIGIYEVLLLSPGLRMLIRPDIEVGKLRAQSMKEGMYTLQVGGARKIAEGVTTVEEVFRVAGAGSDSWAGV
ncbi:MAG: GspE/PulE family protein [Syntrophobacteraceae bacterium]|nr:GspE/PulE family protein [Desulfobacteraceae bacterium]